MCQLPSVLVPIPAFIRADPLCSAAGDPSVFNGQEYAIDGQGRECFLLDPCIVPAVLALWEKGIKTTGCCCGHGSGSGILGVLTEYSHEDGMRLSEAPPYQLVAVVEQRRHENRAYERGRHNGLVEAGREDLCAAAPPERAPILAVDPSWSTPETRIKELETLLATERSARERAERDAEEGWNAAGALRVYRDELLAKIAARDARKYPIMDGPDIPWSVIAPFDKQAMANHGGQNLEVLALRGGLSVHEAIHVLLAQRWDDGAASKRIVSMSKRDAILELQRVASSSETIQSSPTSTDDGPIVCLRRFDPVSRQTVFEPLPPDHPSYVAPAQSSPSPTPDTRISRTMTPEEALKSTGTLTMCPNGCGAFVNTTDVTCVSCRRDFNVVEIQPDGVCWGWFGPAAHRMRCRKPLAHAGSHCEHADRCGSHEPDGFNYCGLRPEHDGPHSWERLHPAET